MIFKNKLILYYFEDNEFSPKWEFVRKELILITNPKKVEYPPQNILSIHFVYTSNNKIVQVKDYVKK